MLLESTGKAVNYPSPDTLLQLETYQIDAIDFTGFPEEHGYTKLNQSIPKNPKYGKEDPPPHYLTSGKQSENGERLVGATSSMRSTIRLEL